MVLRSHFFQYQHEASYRHALESGVSRTGSFSKNKNKNVSFGSALTIIYLLEGRWLVETRFRLHVAPVLGP